MKKDLYDLSVELNGISLELTAFAYQFDESSTRLNDYNRAHGLYAYSLMHNKALEHLKIKGDDITMTSKEVQILELAAEALKLDDESFEIFAAETVKRCPPLCELISYLRKRRKEAR